MPTIRLEQVAKIYKSKERRSAAIRDIDLTIEQGEFVFFVGSRGAGKSTLLDIIAGTLAPDAGRVYLDGIDLSRVSRRQNERLHRCMCKVPEESGLIRTETVYRNLADVKKRPAPLRDRLMEAPLIDKALGLVGMRGTQQRYPLEFSIAQCKRIELAKGILHSPSVLLLDEITTRVDDDTIWDMMQLLSELNVRGTTILMATNAKRFVNIMRKRVVTLSDGRIVGDVRRGRYGDLVGETPWTRKSR